MSHTDEVKRKLDEIIDDFVQRNPTVTKEDVQHLMRSYFLLLISSHFTERIHPIPNKNAAENIPSFTAATSHSTAPSPPQGSEPSPQLKTDILEKNAEVASRFTSNDCSAIRRKNAENTVNNLSFDDILLSHRTFEFGNKNVAVLFKIAQKLNVRGYTKMKKEHLIETLESIRTRYNAPDGKFRFELNFHQETCNGQTCHATMNLSDVDNCLWKYCPTHISQAKHFDKVIDATFRDVRTNRLMSEIECAARFQSKSFVDIMNDANNIEKNAGSVISNTDDVVFDTVSTSASNGSEPKLKTEISFVPNYLKRTLEMDLPNRDDNDLPKLLKKKKNASGNNQIVGGLRAKIMHHSKRDVGNKKPVSKKFQEDSCSYINEEDDTFTNDIAGCSDAEIDDIETTENKLVEEEEDEEEEEEQFNNDEEDDEPETVLNEEEDDFEDSSESEEDSDCSVIDKNKQKAPVCAITHHIPHANDPLSSSSPAKLLATLISASNVSVTNKPQKPRNSNTNKGKRKEIQEDMNGNNKPSSEKKTKSKMVKKKSET